jgi:hypothetical protein
MDHEGLAGGDSPRVNVKDPLESLAIQKPTMVDPHEGGERYEAGGWEHKIFLPGLRAGPRAWMKTPQTSSAWM